MTLKDEIHRLSLIPDTDTSFKLREMRNTWLLFERNAQLPVDEVAQGLALLTELYLSEQEEQIKQTCLSMLSEIIQSRPHAVGKHIDWEALTGRLMQASELEVRGILAVMAYAHDEKYLDLLEIYFEDLRLRFLALQSWIAITYHETYHADPRVLPYLQQAYREATGRNTSASSLKQQSTDEKLRKQKKKKPVFETRPIYPDEMLQVLGQAKEQIQREVPAPYVEDQRSRQEKEADPGTTIQSMRLWLRVRDKTSKREAIEGLDWNFQEDFGASIETIARLVEMLITDALQEEDASVRLASWSVVHKAFYSRAYVGTYVNWSQLTARLPTLPIDELWYVLFYYGYAPDEMYFEVLESYLEHAGKSIRFAAAQAMRDLIYHVSRHCPPVAQYFRETTVVIEGLKEAPDSLETREQLRSVLHALRRKARPHYQYYSV